jgi:hypothetical protein
MNRLVVEFVEASLAHLRRVDSMRLPIPDMPVEMRDDTVRPMNDWIGWKSIPSTVTTRDLNELERELGLRFPPLYRDLLMYRHFYDLAAPFDFFRHPVHSWKSVLRDQYASWMPERIIGAGLVPFGDERLAGAGPVCFDTRQRAADGDCPIVCWDHDRVGTTEEVWPLFSSFAACLSCATFPPEAIAAPSSISKTTTPPSFPGSSSGCANS